MGPKTGRLRAWLNAGFVLAVLALAGFGVVEVARRQWRTQRTFLVRVDFATVGGVGPGDRVRLQGIDAGVVEAVVAPAEPGRPVRLVLRVDERLRRLVRADAVARIVAEGVVGAKVVELVPGKPDAPDLEPSGLIASEAPVEMAELMKRASASLAKLEAVSSAAEEGLREINTIAATVRKGEGTLGRLVNEDEAYQRIVGLSNRGEKTLHELEENLTALKSTWPLSRYFDGRSYYDRDRVLFHPGAAQSSRVLSGEDLFEPGRSVLTAAGRRRLDEVGTWFKQVKRSNSEVVIAAFSDTPRDADLAQILTQEQADAVKKYLSGKHGIESAGWFSSRKVAAVGFGNDAPRTLPADGQPRPSRRVEVIVFTPQA